MNIVVCILFHEKPDQTIESVVSFLPSKCPIVILDNGSSSASRKLFDEKCPLSSSITILKSTENLGVSGGRNFLINNTNEDWLLFVDNDIVVETQDWPNRFATVNDISAEVLIPRLYNKHEGRYTDYQQLVVVKNRAYFVPVEDVEINVFPGGASLVSRGLFERLGLYDDEIFVGGEDFELALRAELAGASIQALLVNDVEFIHDHRQVARSEDVDAVLVRYNKKAIKKSFEIIEKKHKIVLHNNWEKWVDQQIETLVPQSNHKLKSNFNPAFGSVRLSITEHSRFQIIENVVAPLWNSFGRVIGELLRILINTKTKTAGKDKSLKVVFVFNGLKLGGAENQGFVLASHLQSEQGIEVKVIGVNGEPGRLSQMCNTAGIPWASMGLGHPVSRREWLITLIKFTLKMRAEKADILVSYTNCSNILSGLSWRLVGAGGFIWNQADEGLGMGREFINRVAVASTPCFVSNSSGGSQFLQSCYGVPKERVSVIHNGVKLSPPVADRTKWRVRLNVSDSAVVATMVANISRLKDHATLLKAWATVIAEQTTKSNYLLVLAGRFDGVEQELFALADELKISNQVKFIGAVSDVSGLLAASDVFLFSSRSEGLPNAVVEAMSMGLPVAATDIPGVREALGPRAEQFLAKPGDYVDLGAKIENLLGQPSKWQELGHSLKKRAEEHFSLDVMLMKSKKGILFS